MVTKALDLSILLAAGLLALGYALSGRGPWGVAVVVVGGLWLVGRRRGWGWTASVGLVALVGAAAFGLGRGLAPGWALLGTGAALAAWDLDAFARRLGDGGPMGDRAMLERRHLQRLLLVEALGLLLAGAALAVRVRIGFGGALLLGALAVLGLSQVMGFFRREGEA